MATFGEGGTMLGRNCGLGVVLCTLAFLLGGGSGFAQQNDFPFDSEMFLDARPMPGSKRIPNVEIAANGTIAVELWCNRVEGQVVVAGDTITVMVGQPTDRPCTPAQTQRDTDLLSALNEVTNWRREGDAVLLVGAKTLRFKAATH
jgi:heat shock protein HslJ